MAGYGRRPLWVKGDQVARRSWLALLPASKGNAPGGTGPAWRDAATEPALAVTKAFMATVEAGDDATVERICQARSAQVTQARAAVADLLDAPTRPAWQRYIGVVHGAADPKSLDGPVRRRFLDHVAYVSALAGLVAASDPLPSCRLPMAARLDPLGGLATWWRPIVASSLDALLAPGARLWLLTGGEYERAVAWPAGCQPIKLAFTAQRGQAFGTPPSAALKQARGLLARRLAQEPTLARRPDHPGWDEVTFVAGGRHFRLADAGHDHQTWHATAGDGPGTG